MKELEKEFLKLLDWLTRKDSPYVILYGEECRFATKDKNYTTSEVVEIYLSYKNSLNEPSEVRAVDKHERIKERIKCDIPGCYRYAPQNDIFCSKHRYHDNN